MATRLKPRRTQQERSTATRERLMEATVECLMELGYARTTTTEIAQRAGVSRGAQLHHYPTKLELVLSAIEHMAVKWGLELQKKADKLPEGRDRASAAVDLLWSVFSGPLFHAALEMWVAARTDPDLYEKVQPVERRLGGVMKGTLTDLLASTGVKPARAAPLLELTIHLMRGMALERILQPNDKRRKQLLDVWKDVIAEAVNGG